MARAQQVKTQTPGVYKRVIYDGRKCVYDVRDSSGKWAQKGVTSYEEAKALKKQIDADRSRGVRVTNPNQTFGDFATNEWISKLNNRVAEEKLKPRTVKHHETVLRVHLLPEFGTTRLRDIRVETVETFGSKLAAKNLAADTRKGILLVLGYVLKLAVKYERITSNPVEAADKPSAVRREPELPPLSKIRELRSCAPREDVGRLILFTAFAAVRKGEVFALRWENVGLEEGQEWIRVLESYSKGYLSTTKTKAGMRQLVLGREAAAILREQSAAQLVDETTNELGLVFPSPHGGYWDDANFHKRGWDPTRKAASLPELEFHTLRYFARSRLRAAGLAPEFSKILLGHVDDKTHSGYTRVPPEVVPLVRAAVDAAFTEAGE